MAAARGAYNPRAGTRGAAALTALATARAERLASNDRAYRAALGLAPGAPLPRNLGAVMRGGHPEFQRLDRNGGRHSAISIRTTGR